MTCRLHYSHKKTHNLMMAQSRRDSKQVINPPMVWPTPEWFQVASLSHMTILPHNDQLLILFQSLKDESKRDRSKAIFVKIEIPNFQIIIMFIIHRWLEVTTVPATLQGDKFSRRPAMRQVILVKEYITKFYILNTIVFKRKTKVAWWGKQPVVRTFFNSCDIS